MVQLRGCVIQENAVNYVWKSCLLSRLKVAETELELFFHQGIIG